MNKSTLTNVVLPSGLGEVYRGESMGCREGGYTPAMVPHFFASPEKAVEELSRLLADRDWIALSRCYDLSGTAVAPADLESGEFFLGQESPHPAWRGGPVRPFPPGFRYASQETAGDDAVVTVSIAIDEG